MKTLRKTITRRGKYIVLPLTVDTVAEVQLSAYPGVTLVFHDAAGGESLLRIDHGITLTGHGVDYPLPSFSGAPRLIRSGSSPSNSSATSTTRSSFTVTTAG